MATRSCRAQIRLPTDPTNSIHLQLHPLVADLLASATADSAASLAHPLGRAEPSKRWVAEAAKVKDTKPHKGPDGDNSEDEDEEEYDVSAETTTPARVAAGGVADVLLAPITLAGCKGHVLDQAANSLGWAADEGRAGVGGAGEGPAGSGRGGAGGGGVDLTNRSGACWNGCPPFHAALTDQLAVA